ncbi:sensor domain-containing diguanylate cyclase [Aidingimonas halophila]|uniref:diguanylate cyclase n=1 Tax=Aidingimonas halophila TaxID=574349 RepID=A0A1H3B058_9GAMM|nr:sensor domain-containing diguanylate cyclase [Aidingimonas halophila]GHC25652.1 diguanylate cyclase [Aidingimonas halophila]SDX35185.1 PAS domain S-box-containing protein/diguanylate cyclase (GGDEF) domain-containing protein [Aidingimonas halophila]
MDTTPELRTDILRLLDSSAGILFVKHLWEHFPEHMFIIRVEGPEDFIIEAVNPAQQATLGHETACVGKRIDELLSSPTADDVIANYSRCVEEGKPIRYEEKGIYIGPDGAHRSGHWLTLLVPIHDRSGKISHLFGVAQNLTELRLARQALERHNLELERRVAERTAELMEVNQQLTHLATHDYLTNTYNRRHLVHLAEIELRRSHRYDLPLCLMMLDIDDFKTINDHNGHAAGDAALREIADIVIQTVRDCDLVGRYGGDEFLIMMPETTLSGAKETAERLCRALQRTREVRLTLSIGITAREPGEELLDPLVQRADELLLRAKRQGRNRIETEVSGPEAKRQ